MRASRRSGFTLVEVMVALLIGAMVVSAAGALVIILRDRADGIARSTALVDADANGENVLRELAANVTHDGDSMVAVTGTADSVTFRSWCETSEGWLGHCTVRLRFERKVQATLIAEMRGGYNGVLTLRDGFKRGHLVYLEERERRLHWVSSWTSRHTPAALGAVIDRDTLLFPLGPR
jgi:prepilin-type N-terminal cleavage/methylation domain-containing protein